MQVLDAKTTFFDDNGKPLSGGRLRYFAFETTTPISVYADAAYLTPLGSVVALTNAGWTPTCVFAQQSVTVHVDKYIGMDDYGVEQYQEIKVYDYFYASSSGSVSDTPVDTISELKSITPVDGMSVAVNGYFQTGDCPVRTYIYDADSTAIENLGTIIESSVTSVGRWILNIEGPYVDSRIFGVIAGISTVNAAFSALLQYCQINSRTAYFVTGSYYLSGGSLSSSCSVKADSNVKIYSTSAYTLTLHGVMDVADSFAATNVKLILTNPNNIVNSRIWDSSNGLADSEYQTIFATTNLDFTGSSKTITKIILNANISVTGSESLTIDEITGPYAITWTSLAYPSIGICHSSHIVESRAIARVTNTVYVDSNFALGNYSYPANMMCIGGIISGGYGSITGSITGSQCLNFTQNVHINNFIADQHITGNSMVRAFNGSNFSSMDMAGKTATTPLTREATIYNGNLTNVSNTLKAYNSTISGFSGTFLIANNCILSGLPSTQISARLTGCVVSSVVGSGNFNGCQITAATLYSGSSVNDCTITNLYLRPTDGAVTNINVHGCTIDTLTFDANGNIDIDSEVVHTNIDSYITNIAQVVYVGRGWKSTGHTLYLANRKPDGQACNFNQKVNGTYTGQSTQGASYNLAGIKAFVLGYSTIAPAFVRISPVSTHARVQAAMTSDITTTGTSSCIVWEINTSLTQFYLTVGLYQ